MTRLVAAGSPVIVENGALDALGALLAESVEAHRVAIITDSNVGPLYAARASRSLATFAPVTITMPAGEQYKTRDTWAHITDQLLAHGLGRDACIVALGGGVVGDVAGFVAATFLRGIPVVQVPTSLVAMIDASIGGKTGVDAPAGKNLVGAFHAPAFVAVDPDLLSTLPAREQKGGLAEALKHGVIADAAYFAKVAATVPAHAAHIVQRSVEIKADVVSDDPRESGRRKILNFGHTLGHAVESESGYTLSHGESVAMGMVLEARLGEHLGVTARDTASDIERALKSIGLPTKTSFPLAALVARTHSDKKTRAGVVEYALPAAIGRFDRWTVAVPDSDVFAALG